MSIVTISIIVGVVLLVGIILASYVKAPPSVAFLISGLSKEPRVLIGKGGFRIPFFERIDKVFLGQMSVDIKTSVAVPTKDFINVNVDAVAKVRVVPNQEGIRLAGKNFLNMTQTDIQHQLKDSLEGNMREIIGTLDLVSLNTDRDTFSDQIAQKAGKDMSKLGIEILSCNIQNVTDEQNLIKDLGADNTWKIKKSAEVTKAQSMKEIAIAQAEANKEANDARVISETAIAERNNELEIKKADLKKESDVKKAMSDAAYAIQEQEQQKLINERTVEANIAKTRKEQELTEEMIKVRENKLQAEIAKQADADRYKKEIDAAAQKKKTELDAEAELTLRKRQAEAEAYEAEQKAKAVKAEADALKYRMLMEAEGIKAVGEAEASKIKAVGEAEAKALDAKAKAYKNYNDTIKLQEALVEVLPEVAKNVAAPIAALKDVTLYGGDMGQVSKNVPAVTHMVFDTMTAATGVDMKDILKTKTLAAQTDRNISVNGADDVVAVAATK
jgi:flotillin